MKAAIIANGVIADYAATRRKLRDADYLIACDGGLRHFPLLGLSPHCLIGDFDSAPAPLLAEYQSRGIPVIPFPPEKDETDLALAVAHALSAHPESITILGALGGRMDHTLANFHVLAQTGNVPTEIWDENTRIQLLRPGAAVPLHREGYATLSLIPLTSQVAGITTQGLKYPLHNETLRAGETRGVSNVFATQTAAVCIQSGLLLAIMA